MNLISAFADEIGPELEVQLSVLKENGVGNIELRGVWGKNVMDFTEAQVRQIKAAATNAGIGFSAVGSPLGKFPLDGDFQKQLDAVRKALDFAQILEAPYIRIFSYFIPKGEDAAKHRGQVLDWLGKLIVEAEKTRIVLAHENESHIYGDIGDRCLDLFQSLKSPNFTGIFDFANFVQNQQETYTQCWTRLKSHITYFHIKDAVAATGKVVPAGQGDGQIPKILAEAYAAGYHNFLTLEPHLSLAEANFGRTTPALFATATSALKGILAGIPAARI